MTVLNRSELKKLTGGIIQPEEYKPVLGPGDWAWKSTECVKGRQSKVIHVVHADGSQTDYSFLGTVLTCNTQTNCYN